MFLCMYNAAGMYVCPGHLAPVLGPASERYVCVQLCVRVYVCDCLTACYVFQSACVYVCMAVWQCMFVRLSLYVCMCGCVYVFMVLCKHVCISAFLSDCIYVCMIV